jgi:NADH dehydrogenase FAD-containing subunit
MSKSSTKKSVVVVGGGSGGVLVAQQLAAKLDHTTHELTLVDARPHNIWIIAGARMSVSADKEFPSTVVFPYDRVLPPGKGTVRQGRVVEIQENKGGAGGNIVFQDGDKLAYDGEISSCFAKRVHLMPWSSSRVVTRLTLVWTSELPRRQA